MKLKFPMMLIASIMALRCILFPIQMSFHEDDPYSIVHFNANSMQKPIDIIYYDIVDPKFHLVDNMLASEDLQRIFNDVAQTWLTGTEGEIQLRFHKRDLMLDEDRSLAYLFYVFGSPKVKVTAKRTNLAYDRDTALWVVNAFEKEIAEMFDDLSALSINFEQVAVLTQALSTKMELSQPEYNALVPGYPKAYPGLVGTLNNTITMDSFRDFVSEQHKSDTLRRVHLAFRLFYLHCGMSVAKHNQFLALLQSHPMFLLHYAIGRDKSFPKIGNLQRDNVNRTRWEFENTIALLPTYYYHDRNGRGGLKWMDVVFRTASCWSKQSKQFAYKGKEFGEVMCRWGVRDYEEHEYTWQEFSRLISHEIGHCLGLVHNAVTCQTLDTGEQGNLMQQHVTIALKQWSQCKCTLPRCSNCQCPYTNLEYGEVAKARVLKPDQVALAVHFAKRMGYFEADV